MRPTLPSYSLSTFPIPSTDTLVAVASATRASPHACHLWPFVFAGLCFFLTCRSLDSVRCLHFHSELKFLPQVRENVQLSFIACNCSFLASLFAYFLKIPSWSFHRFDIPIMDPFPPHYAPSLIFFPYPPPNYYQILHAPELYLPSPFYFFIPFLCRYLVPVFCLFRESNDHLCSLGYFKSILLASAGSVIHLPVFL